MPGSILQIKQIKFSHFLTINIFFHFKSAIKLVRNLFWLQWYPRLVHVITYSQSLEILRKSILISSLFCSPFRFLIASIRCLYLSFGPVSHKNVIYQTEYALRGFIIINIMIFFYCGFGVFSPNNMTTPKTHWH